ncbi:hypothetical protein BJ993_004840 [Nocardioides aromaticivorans]|uniref:Uncharacterized protein n=1 Tax=Nocardioides aromaticivorans TaxID=200618 RepID=A0A7Z0CR83_9ACTN|nr:hypothetical protein [Nocardioides aromaticivorans]
MVDQVSTLDLEVSRLGPPRAVERTRRKPIVEQDPQWNPRSRPERRLGWIRCNHHALPVQGDSAYPGQAPDSTTLLRSIPDRTRVDDLPNVMLAGGIIAAERRPGESQRSLRRPHGARVERLAFEPKGWLLNYLRAFDLGVVGHDGAQPASSSSLSWARGCDSASPSPAVYAGRRPGRGLPHDRSTRPHEHASHPSRRDRGLGTVAFGTLGLFDAPPGSVAYAAIASTMTLLSIALL